MTQGAVLGGSGLPLDSSGWHEMAAAQRFEHHEAAVAEGKELEASASVGQLWSWRYGPGMLVDTARRRAGVRAMKAELAWLGYAGGIKVDVPFWGDAVTQRTKDFQKDEGLTVDGVIGRVTARHLFRRRAALMQERYGIPDELVCHLRSWESQSDPVAQGPTGDEGHGQIVLNLHPDVSIAQAWDPAFVHDFIGRQLKGAHLFTQDWDGAVAAYNVGWSGAREWVRAGKPTEGGRQIGVRQDGTPILLFAVCSTYVERVHGATC